MRPSIAIALALCASGCFSGTPEHEPLGVASDAQALAAGYLTHLDGVVDPYCHGVLAGPTHVVTARSCASAGASFLSFAVEHDLEQAVPVLRARTEAVPADWIVLELEAPLDGARAAPIAAMPEVGAMLELTSFTYVDRDQGSPRPARWTAEVIALEEDSFVAEWRTGAPGCHGDSGVAAFHGGQVAGVLVGALGGGPAQPQSSVCRSRYRFRRVSL